MQINKMTWQELDEFLCKHHDREGVIVFKQHPTWRKEYSERERSYRVSGDCNHFHNGKISNAIFGFCLDENDPDAHNGVRLDWVIYALPDERWHVDYCYLLPPTNE